MHILVLGGTRFFGIPMIKELLEKGHDVTIATRGNVKDGFHDRIKRIIVDRTDAEEMKEAFKGQYYDVVIDKIAYCSNDINMQWSHLILADIFICQALLFIIRRI